MPSKSKIRSPLNVERFISKKFIFKLFYPKSGVWLYSIKDRFQHHSAIFLYCILILLFILERLFAQVKIFSRQWSKMGTDPLCFHCRPNTFLHQIFTHFSCIDINEIHCRVRCPPSQIILPLYILHRQLRIFLKYSPFGSIRVGNFREHRTQLNWVQALRANWTKPDTSPGTSLKCLPNQMSLQ